MNSCPTLPVTGASTTSLLVMAAALLVFGVLLVVAVRWRRHPVVPVIVALAVGVAVLAGAGHTQAATPCPPTTTAPTATSATSPATSAPASTAASTTVAAVSPSTAATATSTPSSTTTTTTAPTTTSTTSTTTTTTTVEAAASLVVTNPTYNCGGVCWGHVSGSGLLPGATFQIYASGVNFGEGAVASTGMIDSMLSMSCGAGLTNIYVTSTTASGDPIESNHVESPCG